MCRIGCKILSIKIFGGHAAELTREAVKERYDFVISVGGDGTCNEIARSLVHTDTALGIVPVGSGNGLARHLGIPLNPIRALRILNDAIVDNIDYCKANDKTFFVLAVWASMRG